MLTRDNGELQVIKKRNNDAQGGIAGKTILQKRMMQERDARLLLLHYFLYPLLQWELQLVKCKKSCCIVLNAKVSMY